ncbi:MAG TPA: WhiB family transcriptional regulator [Micromonosporaceae bacterium]|nr:WhiB family transcriptional regulator [Micromonosporaceae bacterium]
MTATVTHRGVKPYTWEPDRRDDWRDQAACNGRDPALWDLDTRGTGRHAAQAICRGCPVRPECLADAVGHRATGVIRGGWPMPSDSLKWPKLAAAGRAPGSRGCAGCGMPPARRHLRWCLDPCRPRCGTSDALLAHHVAADARPCRRCGWAGTAEVSSA